MRQATLQDLILERWLREREAKKIVWETKNGAVIPINEMDDTHLNNTIRMIERNNEMMERNNEMMADIGDMDPMDYYD